MLPSLFNKLNITRLGAATTPDSAQGDAQSIPFEGRSVDCTSNLSQGLLQLNLDGCAESSEEEEREGEEEKDDDEAGANISGSDRTRDSFEHVLYEDSDEYSNWSIPCSAPITPTLSSPTQSLPAPSTQEDDPLPLLLPPQQHRNLIQEYHEEQLDEPYVEQPVEQPEDDDYQDDSREEPEAEPHEELPKQQLYSLPLEEHHEEPTPLYEEEEEEEGEQELQQQQHYKLRLPLEIWVKICSHLYPSQLARFSRVNQTAYCLVASLERWEGWFKRLHGKPHTKLKYLQEGTNLRQEMHIMRPIPGLSISQSYMLFMCAISLQVCEKCFRRCDGKLQRGRLACMPLPVVMSQRYPERLPLPLPPPLESIDGDESDLEDELACCKFRDDDDEDTEDDDEQDDDDEDEDDDDDEDQEKERPWTIRMCKGCRIKHYERHPEQIPQEITTSFLTKRVLRQKYRLGNKEVQAITTRSRGNRKSGMPVTYSEADALIKSRRVYGGDVGRLAAPRSLLQVMQKLNNRVYIYHRRRGVLEAGGVWLSLEEYRALKAAGLLSLLYM
ncbi:hypothetical protein BGX34_001752 [Mortierella sp. NVP85]|nr:hypothetical protein BGX34_001752 [Mortierella sp. NVP85]